MAQSCLAPGSNTMLENLFQSFGSNARDKGSAGFKDADGDGRDDRDAGAGGFNVNPTKSWKQEYEAGVDCEMYRVALADVLVGLSFRDAARAVYDTPVTRFAEHFSHIGGSEWGAQTLTGPSAPRIRSQRLCIRE